MTSAAEIRNFKQHTASKSNFRVSGPDYFVIMKNFPKKDTSTPKRSVILI